MNGQLQGAVALVTGAGGGIGGAIVRAMADAGATVIATDIGASAEIAGAAEYHQHDVTSAGDWARIADAIQARHGRLTALVNNAGISLTATIADTSLDDWRRVFAVNVDSILLSLHACLDLLKAGGADWPGGASVVNLSSVGGQRGAAMHACYCASKGAVKLLTKSAADEYGRFGFPIRVNSIHPGGVDTAMLGKIMATGAAAGGMDVEAVRSAVIAQHPIGRLGRPEEIAPGIVYLCSPGAAFVTGAELTIDGGFTAI